MSRGYKVPAQQAKGQNWLQVNLRGRMKELPTVVTALSVCLAADRMTVRRIPLGVRGVGGDTSKT